MKHLQKLHTVETIKKCHTITDRINTLRVARKLSQRALAAKSGVAHITIAKAECREYRYSLPTLMRLCDALDITLSELFTDI